MEGGVESQGSGDAVLGSKLEEPGGAAPPDLSCPPSDQGSKVSCPEVLTTTALAILGTLMYLAVGSAVYQWLEGFSTVDAVYFCVVSMSTVGYGDLSPETPGGRAFTILWIVFGIVIVYASLSKVVNGIVSPFTNMAHDVLERVLPAEKVTLEGDGTLYVVPEAEVWYYAKNLLPSFLLNFTSHFIFAGIFLLFEPEWSYSESLWHCMVTATTVGYGDLTPTTEASKLCATVHIVVSVALLGELFGNVSTLIEKRKAQKKKLAQLRRQFDEGLLEDLFECAQDLRPEGIEKAERSISELEFVISMLVELEILQWSDVHPLIAKFRAFDVSGNRRLDREDLQLLLQQPEAQRRRVVDIMRRAKLACKARRSRAQVARAS